MFSLKSVGHHLMAISVALSAVTPLSGCASTTITSSDNAARDIAGPLARLPDAQRPYAWRDYRALPVVVYGSAPGHPQAELSRLFPQAAGSHSVSDRHLVIYINAVKLPARAAWCSDTAAFKSGVQTGDSAVVAGALCNGNLVVTSATGRVLTKVDSVRWLRSDFDIIRDQLYLSLYPGTNDPGKFATN